MTARRLPGKPLLDICGKPMIIRVWERLRRMKGIDRCLIATPDAEIADAARKFGAPCVMTSGRCRSGTDRVAEAASAIDCDVVVNVQGDEPMIDPGNVRKAVSTLLSSPGNVMSTLMCPIATKEEMADPNAVKVVTDMNGRALYFTRSPVPASVSGPLSFPTGRKDPFGRHVGIYVYRKSFLIEFAGLSKTPLETAESLEQLRALEHGYTLNVGFVKNAVRGVDTADDLKNARAIFSRAQGKK